MAFDPATGVLWAADVGEGDREEVDIIEAGRNYGWNFREGTICYPEGSSCNNVGMTGPVAEYSHAEGCSIAGGFVYRGVAIPSLVGHYLYGDFCTGNVWVLDAIVDMDIAGKTDGSFHRRA